MSPKGEHARAAPGTAPDGPSGTSFDAQRPLLADPEGHGADDLFDWPLILGWSSFLLRAPRRHPFVAVLAFATTLVAVLGALAVVPRTYHTEAKVIASKNLVMPALGNPQRAIPNDADAPTRAAPESILRRDNLLVLIEQTDLMKQWELSRAPIAKLKDFVLARLHGPLDADEKRDALAYTLERRLKVWTGDDTITIEIDWPDAAMAYRLASLAQQNFLESRHAREVSTIAEAISILEGHAAQARERVDYAMEQLRKERSNRRAAVTAPFIAAPRTLPVAAEPHENPELANLRLMLNAKRQALRELEQYRERRLAELQAQLAEQMATYTPAHPLVMAMRESIESLRKDSPQLISLRREEQELLRQYGAAGGKDPSRPAAERRAGAVPSQMSTYYREFQPESVSDTDSAVYWRTQLDFAIQKLEDLVSRIDAARIELDTARAAFKYRYAVFRPAEVPKRPTKPNIPLIAAAGVVLSVLLGFFASAALDVRRRVLVQAWQVEQQLGIPLLAKIHER